MFSRLLAIFVNRNIILIPTFVKINFNKDSEKKIYD